MKETTINDSFHLSLLVPTFHCQIDNDKAFLFLKTPFCLPFSLFMMYLNDIVDEQTLRFFNDTKNVNCGVGIKGFLFPNIACI